MASVSSQPQFRYTQTPSKVLHLRNLPWECTEEELIELGKPFGKVVNTKCNVGANRNQAFIEFAEQNQAIAMISYYASSSEPAQVRGKTVYLQYSNRQEIVNNKTSADVAGNVLLVTIEGNDARLVSIDVLHLVFSAFGFVHKITTFEKTAGFQALVQFTDSETATSAKDALDGRSIPRYLIPELGPCSLKITYSAHTDLSVKFQSHRSRDYTNPMLPVASSAIDATGQFSLGLDGKKIESESNVLLASIENMQYAVTLDVLHMVFSAFGPVLKIAMFDKNGGVQALIQYPEVQTAVVAKEALEGHCIYDGGFCKLHISYSRHTDLSIKGLYEWPEDSNGVVYKVWLKCVKKRFPDTMRKAREKSIERAKATNVNVSIDGDLALLKPYYPSWINKEDWATLIDEVWNTPKWKHLSQSGSQNRNKLQDGSVSKHCAGSISTRQHKKKMEAELKRPPTGVELYTKLHTKKSTQEYVTTRSKKVKDAYEDAMVAKYGDDTDCHPLLDNETWVDVSGGIKKGCIFGFGSISNPESFLTGASSTSTSREAVYSCVREEMREEMEAKHKEMHAELDAKQQEINAKYEVVEAKQEEINAKYEAMEKMFSEVRNMRGK